MIVTETITHFRTLTEPATFRRADCGVPTTTTILKLPSTAVTVYQVSVEIHVASRRTEHVVKGPVTLVLLCISGMQYLLPTCVLFRSARVMIVQGLNGLLVTPVDV